MGAGAGAATQAAPEPDPWESWPEVLPDAGTAPALLLGLLAIAGALLRMSRGRR